MPHQCVRCNTFYPDDAKEIINGCSSCTGKLFFYVKQAKTEQSRQMVDALPLDVKEEIESQVGDVLGQDVDELEESVVVAIESIKLLSDGKYELDLEALFDKEKPVIYKISEGKYSVDLDATMSKLTKKRK
jgi:uncharacterized protein